MMQKVMMSSPVGLGQDSGLNPNGPTVITIGGEGTGGSGSPGTPSVGSGLQLLPDLGAPVLPFGFSIISLLLLVGLGYLAFKYIEKEL